MKKKLALISPLLRRDLHAPLRHFTKFTVYHIYQEAISGDLVPDDFTGNEIQYRSRRDLYRVLSQLRPAIIQGSEPTWFPKTLPVCRVTRSLAKEVPLYFPVLENRPLKAKYGSCGGVLMKRYLRWYAGAARLIYAVNKGAEDNLLAAGIPSMKIRRRLYGTWGVELDEYYPGPDEQREPVILFVGRLEAAKGIWYLLDAFLKLRGQFPELRLEIIGGGPLRRQLAGFVEDRKLAGQVVLRGVVPNRQIANEFRRARLTCIPSFAVRDWEEQVGMANLQSLACGTPVVSTLAGANAEMVCDGETGRLVAPKESGALADAMAGIIRDGELWQRMSTASVKLAQARYDARKNIQEIEEELLALL